MVASAVLVCLTTSTKLKVSQEEQPQTHSSQRIFARRCGISLGSVNTINKRDLRLTCLKKSKVQSLADANKLSLFKRCCQLLRQYPASMVNIIWFTDEKLFTVKSPRNAQNDRVYAPVGTRKKDILASRLLQTRSKLQPVTDDFRWGIGSGANSDTFC